MLPQIVSKLFQNVHFLYQEYSSCLHFVYLVHFTLGISKKKQTYEVLHNVCVTF